MDRFKELVTGNHWFLPIDVCLFQGVPIDFPFNQSQGLEAPKSHVFLTLLLAMGKNHC